jgi:hypothetical protein
MPSQLYIVRQLAEEALKNDTPQAYHIIYRQCEEIFRTLFDQYYKKFVLDKPTIEERWDAYSEVPVEWLKHSRWLDHWKATVIVDDSERTVDLTHNWVYNYDRGHEFTRDDIVEHINDLIYRIEEDGEYITVELDYQYPKTRSKILLEMDIINQWK